MPQEQKLSAEEKVKIVQAFIQGKISITEAARISGCYRDAVKKWIYNYEVDGIDAFLPHKNRVYSPEIKLQAVLDYLSGSASPEDICKKYHIRSTNQLRAWLKVYNNHGDFNSAKHSGGGSNMKQGRNTTQEEHQEKAYPIEPMCELLHVSHSAYYKWASGKQSRREAENEQLAEKIEQIHNESPDKGYRRINDDLRHDHNILVNDKRILRICRAKDIKSTIKYSNHSCTRSAKGPQYIAENVLNRQFSASKPNEKWLTDVTEFKWYKGVEIHKVYLSAIRSLRPADRFLCYQRL